MNRLCNKSCGLIIAAFSLAVAVAQRGTAPKGIYKYPSNYRGETFTGDVLRSDDRHLILEYKGDSRSEIFTGRLEGPCTPHLKADPHQAKEIHLSTIPNHTVVTAFYNTEKSSKGAKENVVLAIRFERWNGRDFTNPKRPLIPCSAEKKQDKTN